MANRHFALYGKHMLFYDNSIYIEQNPSKSDSISAKPLFQSFSPRNHLIITLALWLQNSFPAITRSGLMLHIKYTALKQPARTTFCLITSAGARLVYVRNVSHTKLFRTTEPSIALSRLNRWFSRLGSRARERAIQLPLPWNRVALPTITGAAHKVLSFTFSARA